METFKPKNRVNNGSRPLTEVFVPLNVYHVVMMEMEIEDFEKFMDDDTSYKWSNKNLIHSYICHNRSPILRQRM